jgi:hypothetical protein
LAHQPRLQAHLGIAHGAFEFGFGDERGHRVNDDSIDRAAAHEVFCDLQGLLAGVRLAQENLVQVDADGARVVGIEGMFGINERDGASEFLGLRDDMQCERRLAGGLWAEDLHDPSSGNAPNAQGDIE